MIEVALLKEHLHQYNLGTLLQCTPLLGGTVNSNYLIYTQKGKWVLTIFEVMPNHLAHQISQFLLFLNNHQFPTPVVQHTLSKKVIIFFQDKPSIIVTYIKGSSPLYPTPQQCYQIGSTLGELHNLTQSYISHLPNTMNNTWREQTAHLLMSHFTLNEQDLIRSVLQEQANLPYKELPYGIIHFDLFRDNTLFIGKTLKGIIDFYYACYDTLLLDLSICMHDWCTNWQDPKRTIIKENLTALKKGYELVRPLTEIEHNTMPSMLKISALHFWLARSQSLKKDPNDYKQIFMNQFSN